MSVTYATPQDSLVFLVDDWTAGYVRVLEGVEKRRGRSRANLRARFVRDAITEALRGERRKAPEAGPTWGDVRSERIRVYVDAELKGKAADAARACGLTLGTWAAMAINGFMSRMSAANYPATLAEMKRRGLKPRSAEV